MPAGLLGTAQCQRTRHEGQDCTAESGDKRGTRQPPYLQLCSSPQPKHGVYLVVLPYLAQIQGLFPEVGMGRGDTNGLATITTKKDTELEHD